MTTQNTWEMPQRICECIYGDDEARVVSYHSEFVPDTSQAYDHKWGTAIPGKVVTSWARCENCKGRIE